jgi:flagellar protein FliS
MPPAALAAYRNADIATLTQQEMIVRLYQGILKFMHQAEVAFIADKKAEGAQFCLKAKKIVIELLATLDRERGGAIAKQLSDLYLFFVENISEAAVTGDTAALRRLRQPIVTLLDAWQSIRIEDGPDSVAV